MRVINAGNAQHAPSGRFGTDGRCVWLFGGLCTSFGLGLPNSHPYYRCYAAILEEWCFDGGLTYQQLLQLAGFGLLSWKFGIVRLGSSGYSSCASFALAGQKVFILLLLDPPVYRSVHFVLESAPYLHL